MSDETEIKNGFQIMMARKAACRELLEKAVQTTVQTTKKLAQSFESLPPVKKLAKSIESLPPVKSLTRGAVDAKRRRRFTIQRKVLRDEIIKAGLERMARSGQFWVESSTA